MGNPTTSEAARWLNRHADFKAGLDADQTEFRAALMGAVNLDEGLRDDRQMGAPELDTPGVRSPWLEQQEVEEDLSSAIAEEIDRRALLLKDAYPFRRSGNSLSYRPSQSGVYEFCLAVTVSPSLSAGLLASLPVAFEFLARDALLVYAGGAAEGLRTGWPRHEADGLPTRAKHMFAEVHKRTGEWNWHPEKDKPDDPEPKHVKDLGLDVLVWKAMPDDRFGQLFLLGQCACGTSRWEDKWRDLDLEELAVWLRPATVVSPVRCFCVPFHIGNLGKLSEVSKKAGLTLDRSRITLLAESNPEFIARHALAPYGDWIETVAQAMSVTVKEQRRRKPQRRR